MSNSQPPVKSQQSRGTSASKLRWGPSRSQCTEIIALKVILFTLASIIAVNTDWQVSFTYADGSQTAAKGFLNSGCVNFGKSDLRDNFVKNIDTHTLELYSGVDCQDSIGLYSGSRIFQYPDYIAELPHPEPSFSILLLLVLFDLLLIGPLCPQRSVGSFYASRDTLCDVFCMRLGCGPLQHVRSIDTGILLHEIQTSYHSFPSYHSYLGVCPCEGRQWWRFGPLTYQWSHPTSKYSFHYSLKSPQRQAFIERFAYVFWWMSFGLWAGGFTLNYNYNIKKSVKMWEVSCKRHWSTTNHFCWILIQASSLHHCSIDNNLVLFHARRWKAASCYDQNLHPPLWTEILRPLQLHGVFLILC